jgi:hypothetical protein
VKHRAVKHADSWWWPFLVDIDFGTFRELPSVCTMHSIRYYCGEVYTNRLPRVLLLAYIYNLSIAGIYDPQALVPGIQCHKIETFLKDLYLCEASNTSNKLKTYICKTIHESCSLSSFQLGLA